MGSVARRLENLERAAGDPEAGVSWCVYDWGDGVLWRANGERFDRAVMGPRDWLVLIRVVGDAEAAAIRRGEV